jgi:RNA polymerase sigma factor (sigma-70 family)
MDSTSDNEARLKPLMLASLTGDQRAYRVLLGDLQTHLNRYYLRRLGDPAAADDLVQETLMAIHTRRLTYDPARPFTAWLHAIARYKLIDYFRRAKLRQTLPLEEDAALFAADDASDATARMDVDTMLATLPDRPAELIRKVKIEGSTVADAADSAGMSETAAKVAIHRGIRALITRFTGGDK